MKGFVFDATDAPDLFPPLVALAAYCEGESRIKGVSRLVHKESNRAVSLMPSQRSATTDRIFPPAAASTLSMSTISSHQSVAARLAAILVPRLPAPPVIETLRTSMFASELPV
jgi:hypothetical protein